MRITSFWYGFTLPLHALKKIISQPELIFWSILPLIMTLGLYSIFISQIQTQTKLLMQHSLATWGMTPNGWGVSLLLLLSKILLFFISALTFSFAANLVACPFNDLLAEKTEPFSTPPFEKVSPKSFSRKIQILGLDLLRTLIATGINLVALLFSWIPFLNFLALLLTFLVISFQFISYPQSRRGQGIQEGVAFVWNHLYSCLGFGLAFTFLLSIPILSSFCLPLAVVGGTLLVGRAKGSHTLTSLK